MTPLAPVVHSDTPIASLGLETGSNLTISLSPTSSTTDNPLPIMKYFSYPGLVGLGLITLVSCGPIVNSAQVFLWRDRLYHRTMLSFLDPVVPMANLQQHREDTIYLQGQVKDHLPLVGKALYELADRSGQVWVITDQPLPPLGQTITIRATIHYQSAPAGQQDWGEYYAQELERLPQPSP